ncbi:MULTISPECIES: alpha/beta fold hydrolase [Halomonadaceae]|uniref:alpha/beta fold hydrolase n=1 Tax=Halomonadaceae TaxID=28256 RepID=UPI001598260E|nr:MULTISPECIES: alpha/beta hydrolase [Halomonas]QJQ95350.1 alpha/beta hydrolase [Halomonas sp. PA5]
MNEPKQLRLGSGRLAGLAWGEESAPVWLALHGWLDNAASFTRLAPLLVDRLGIRLVAIDFAGHGESNRHPPGTDYALWDYCHDVLDVLDGLALTSAPLLAHSMGAAVSCLLAAALPERVERMMLIDGVGMLTTPAEKGAEQLRKGLLGHRRRVSPSPRYADIEMAVAARVAGGVTPLDAVTAEPIVRRNVETLADGHVRLRTDARLLRPSLVRFCPQQALGILMAIETPTLLIEGREGILGEREDAELARSALRGLERRIVPGGHHLHLEPAAVATVADAIVAWRQEEAS